MLWESGCSNNLLIEKRSLSSQCRSLQGFWTTSLFIFYSFSCKLWLWSIQNYGIILMPEIIFKPLHTPIWSCCALLLESEQTPSSQTGGLLSFAQDSICNVQNCSCALLLREHWIIKGLSEEKSVALVGYKISPIPMTLFHITFHFTRGKKSVISDSQPEIYKQLKSFCLLY